MRTQNPGSWLVVTPAHNEAERLPGLAASLAAQSRNPIALWVIVDDGSSDDTRSVAESLQVPFPKRVISGSNRGGLIGGSAFSAWQLGVDEGLRTISSPAFIMKLDADVRLSPNYFEVLKPNEADADLLGGVPEDERFRDQAYHLIGAIKAYSSSAYDTLLDLPRAVGFDVMDEVAAKMASLNVVVNHRAKYNLSRLTGLSQGKIHGRYRNGRVCRWTGYGVPYLLLHAFRYSVRPPYILGTAAILIGYAGAGQGPYAKELKRAHRREQWEKLYALARAPRATRRQLYRTE